MKIKSGIEPLDGRLGGLAPGGLHVVAGAPGSGRLIALLQFLAQGLETGARAGFVGAVAPERLLEQGRHWGLDLERPWREGRLRLLTFDPDFERRLLSAAEPGEAFAELGSLLESEGGLERLAIHPGAPLWDTGSGTNLANHFLRWTEGLGATTWATLASDLEDTLSPGTEWVLQAAAGLFHLERLPSGLHQLSIRRLSPPEAVGQTFTLEAVPGRGLTAPTGRLDRRRTDASRGSEGRLAILRLAPELPAELRAWAREAHEDGVVVSEEPLELLDRLQKGETFGLILLYVERQTVDAAVQACGVLRGLARAPILVAAEERLRSGDRVRALQAGATEVLSAPLSLAELAFRSQQIREGTAGEPAPAGRRSPPFLAAAGSESGAGASARILDPRSFARIVRERLADPEWRIFSLVRVRAPGGLAEPLRLALLSEVRGDSGDLVGTLGAAFSVLLQGAEVEHVDRFMARVQRELGSEVPLSVRRWSGLLDREAIEAALEEAEAGSSSVAS